MTQKVHAKQFPVFLGHSLGYTESRLRALGSQADAITSPAKYY